MSAVTNSDIGTVMAERAATAARVVPAIHVFDRFAFVRRGPIRFLSNRPQPRPDPLHRLVHFSRGAGIAESDEVVSALGVEVDAGRCRDAGLVQNALGEGEAVVGEAR